MIGPRVSPVGFVSGKAACATPFVVVGDCFMRGFPPLHPAPDRDYFVGGLRRDLVEQPRELVDARNRMADGWVEQKQDALQHRCGHAECFGGDYQGFAGAIGYDPLGEVGLNAER
jgi:hypothetical protein